MEKRPSCLCLQEAATRDCDEADFFYDNRTGDMTIECCFYNATSEVQEDVELEWNFCPQCGSEYIETTAQPSEAEAVEGLQGR